MSPTVVFPHQPPGPAWEEVVEVDGERLRLHDYERLYAVPGLYEEIVGRRLRCRAPAVTAALLARAARGRPLRVLDAGAGNGMSGEALAAANLVPVAAVDVLPAARDAARRDRPGLYGTYLVADLTALTAAQEEELRSAAPQALACVGAVGGGHLPPAAVAAALALLDPPALLAYGYDAGAADPLARLPEVGRVLARERYVHRLTVTGGERIWEAVVAQSAVRTLPKR